MGTALQADPYLNSKRGFLIKKAQRSGCIVLISVTKIMFEKYFVWSSN